MSDREEISSAGSPSTSVSPRMREVAQRALAAEPEGLNRSWVQSLLAGDARGAYQEIEQYLSVPPDFAWLVLAMPMDSDCLRGFRALMGKYLQIPPSPEIVFFLVDEYINSERYGELRKFDLCWQPTGQPIPGLVAPEIHYSDEDTCMYDCYRRHSQHPGLQQPDAMTVPILMAAAKRQKWKFLFEAGLDQFTPRWHVVMLEEWKKGVVLPDGLKALIYRYALDDAYLYQKLPGNVRMEEIMWEAFSRGDTVMMHLHFRQGYCQECLQSSPLNNDSTRTVLASMFSGFGVGFSNGMDQSPWDNILFSKFSDKRAYESVCAAQGKTIEELLDYLLNECMGTDWLTKQRLDMFTAWAKINEFPALSSKLAQLRHDQEANPVDSQCFRSYLSGVMKMAARERSRETDELQVQKIAAIFPQIIAQFGKELPTFHVPELIGTPLGTAAAHWSRQTVQAILNAGAGSELGQKELGPLYYAIKRRNPKIVQLLLEHQARPDLLLRPESSQIFEGAPVRTSKINPLNLLCQLPWDSEDGSLAADTLACARLFPTFVNDRILRSAIGVGNVPMVEFSLEQPTREKMITNKNKSGNIPLYSAIDDSPKRAPIFNLLLQHTPTELLRVPNNDGDTFFHLVITAGGHKIICDALKSMTAQDTIVLGQYQWTPLMSLVESRWRLEEEHAWDIACQLLDLGGTDQLVIPDYAGKTIFAKMCKAPIMAREASDISFAPRMMETILDMLPDVDHMAGVTVPPNPPEDVLLLLLRRGLTTIEEIEAQGATQSSLQSVWKEMCRSQRKRPVMESEDTSAPHKHPKLT